LTAERPKLRVFLDAGVPDSVGVVFSKNEHDVFYYRDYLPEKVADKHVCAQALTLGATLVGIDRDLKQFPTRFGVSQNSDRFKKLSIIRLCCNETLANKRLQQAMTLIEHEWAVSGEGAVHRLWVDVGPHHMRTNR
jgi:hypothetical protein